MKILLFLLLPFLSYSQVEYFRPKSKIEVVNGKKEKRLLRSGTKITIQPHQIAFPEFTLYFPRTENVGNTIQYIIPNLSVIVTYDSKRRIVQIDYSTSLSKIIYK